MSTARRPKDHDQRRGAVFTERHAFVWAGAGTGKTTVLTLRALYLILHTPFNHRFGEETKPLYAPSTRREALAAARRAVRSVALITFTRKAAAEMKDRLFGYLNALAAMDERDFRTRFGRDNPLLVEVVDRVLEEFKSVGWTGASDPEPYRRLQAGAALLAELAPELQISTIHAWAARILQRNPLQAGLPRDAVFADEDNPLNDLPAEQLAARWLERVALEQPALRNALESVLRIASFDDVREWLVTIARQPWVVDALSRWRRDLPEVDAQALISAIRNLQARVKPSKNANVIRFYHALWSRIAERIEQGDGGAWIDPGVEAAAAWDKYFGKSTVKNKIKELGPDVEQWLAHRQRFVGVVYLHAMRAGLDGPFRAWMKLNRAFRNWSEGAELRELRVVTFDEMVRLAAGMLARHPGLRQRERAELQALLMDEFQDTDPDQLELVRQVLVEKTPKEHEVCGFFVGDEKQSIYRFRGVDLAHIHAFETDFSRVRFEGRVEVFRLDTNFRCNPEILDYVNSGFEPLFGRQPAIQCEPQKLNAHRTEPRIGPELVDVDPLVLGLDGRAEPTRELAANEVVRQIHAYMEAGQDRTYRDIMVLVRSNFELETLLPRLADAGIPTVSSGTKTYYGNPEVLDLLNLLIALHNPLDTVAGAAVLRSPFVCVNDTDLHRFICEGALPGCFDPDRPVDLSVLPERARSRIRQARRLARLRRTEPLNLWLQAVRRFVPWPLYARTDDLEARFFVRFKTLLDAYRDVVTSGTRPPLAWLLVQRERAAAAGAWDADLGEDVTVTDEAVDAVRAMTIHKAKGLEARFVLIYGWAGPLADMDAEKKNRVDVVGACELTKNGRLTELSGINKTFGPMQIATTDYDQAVTLAAAQQRAEAVRMAYVACTRARDRLTLVLAHRSGLKLSDRALRLCGLSSTHPPPDALRVTAITPAILKPPVTADARAPLNFTEAYAAYWRDRMRRRNESMRTSLVSSPTAALAEVGRSDTGPSGPQAPSADRIAVPSAETARVRGILVHAYLEHHLTDEAFEPNKLEDLAHRTCDPPPPTEALEQAALALQGFYSGAFKDRSGRSYRDRVRVGRILAREVPFHLTWKRQAWCGVADLVLAEQDRITAVDYKTLAPLDPAEEQRRYGIQREMYTEALRRIFNGREVGFEIFWLPPDPKSGRSASRD